MKGRSIYAKERNILKEIYISQRNIEYYNIRDSDFQSTLQIYLPRLSRKSKISDCNFFTNHGRRSFKALSLLLYLWSF